ncbi:MAG: peptidylprolyl isomerase [Pseudomonadales bacterium]
MSRLSRLNKPWLHFIVLGGVLYLLQSTLFPEPKPTVEPLSEARIVTLKEQWRSSTGREPTEEQLSGFIAVELDRDMLMQHALGLEFHLHDSIVYERLIRNMKFLQFAQSSSDAELFEQALEMRLHLDDEVVKRRLIQMMEQRLLANYPPSPPTAEDVEAAFESRKSELQHPPLYSFEHIFFGTDQAAKMRSVIAKISDEKLDIQAARTLGAPFMQGHRFLRQTPEQLARNFGRHFVEALVEAMEREPAKLGWLGPMPSAYGLHYIWLADYEPTRDAELQEIQQQLLIDLNYSAEKRALRCAIATLRSEYVMQGGASNEQGCQ